MSFLFQIQLKKSAKWENVGNHYMTEEDASKTLRKILNEYDDELNKSKGVFQYRIIRRDASDYSNQGAILSSARVHALYGYKIIQGDNWDIERSVGLHDNLVG